MIVKLGYFLRSLYTASVFSMFMFIYIFFIVSSARNKKIIDWFPEKVEHVPVAS